MTEPTNLVALGERRERAIALIGQRYAEGVIDDDEVDRRLELAEEADDIAALDRLTVDLRGPDDVEALAEAPAPIVALVRAEAAPRSRRLLTIFSDNEYRGHWTPARRNTVINVLGNTELDLRDAQLSPETEIRVRVVLGDVVIVIPPDLPLTVEVVPVLGDIKRDDESAPPSADAPRVVVRGFVVLGDLKIRVQRRGESWSETKRRRKLARRERKRKLKAAEKRRQLPP
ncbi:MAG: LiaF-related protein [Nannocystaceae bacterium]